MFPTSSRDFWATTGQPTGQQSKNSKPNWASVSALRHGLALRLAERRHARPRRSSRRQGGLVRLRRPRPPHLQDIRRNHHPLRLGRQRATARMDGDGRIGRKRDGDLALRTRHVRACRQACCQRRLLLHHLRLPRYASASLRQKGQQSMGTGAGHLRAAKETAILVHSI